MIERKDTGELKRPTGTIFNEPPTKNDFPFKTTPETTGMIEGFINDSRHSESDLDMCSR